jgi:diguanylate cyclase (GGDEF)-like protein
MTEQSTVRRFGIDVVDFMRLMSSRPVGLLEGKFEDYRVFTVLMMLLLGFVAASFWVWDVVVDPVGAHKTVALRLLFIPVGLIPAAAVALTRSKHLRVLQAIVGAMLVSAVVLFSAILNQLKLGSLWGIGGYMFLMLAIILICQGFSPTFSIGLTIVAGGLPHVLALIGFIHTFHHLQYAVLLWPAVSVTCVALLAMSYNYAMLFDTRRKLERVSAIDPLTDAANRRMFLPLLEQEVARSRRFGHSVSMLMIDIDEFKLVNDRSGHSVGDLVLKRLAETCRAAIRESDTFARLGGDEFAILLPETSVTGALGLAESIRSSVETSSVPGPDGPVNFTVSVGAAQSQGIDVADGDLLRRADSAMYAAKHAGRNCVRGS